MLLCVVVVNSEVVRLGPGWKLPFSRATKINKKIKGGGKDVKTKVQLQRITSAVISIDRGEKFFLMKSINFFATNYIGMSNFFTMLTRLLVILFVKKAICFLSN
jgi:hypothetical protein